MDKESEDAIRRELGPGEEILWAGQPPQRFLTQPSDAFALLLMVVYGGGFIVLGFVMILSEKVPVWARVLGSPFLLGIGLFGIFGVPWLHVRRQANTFYVVTSDRVIFLWGLFTRNVKSLKIDLLADVVLSERRDGSGRIFFGQVLAPTFILEGQARKVYEIIRAAQRVAKPQP
jgi:hypothetical protein